jgi:hypothetical protein
MKIKGDKIITIRHHWAHALTHENSKALLLVVLLVVVTSTVPASQVVQDDAPAG